jgi:DNA repair protein RadC
MYAAFGGGVRVLLINFGNHLPYPTVFAPAIEKRAAAIVLVHNHPSGDPKPSKADFDITRRLKECGELIGIGILDHLIIAGGLYYSFVDESTI